MRLRLFVVSAFVLSLLAPAAAHAQQRPHQVLLGATFAHMKLEDAAPLTASWRGNFSLGIDLGVPLFPVDSPVQLRTEAMLVARGGHVDTGAYVEKLKMLYVDVAPLIDWNIAPSVGQSGLHLLVGPSFGIRANTAASVNGISVDLGGVFKRFDVGLLVGAQFTAIPKVIDVQAMYIAGFMNILTDDPYVGAFFPPGSKAKNQTLLILVSPTIFR